MSDPVDKKSPDRPTALPGLYRYQFFTDIAHRMQTRNINRLSLFGIAGFVAADVIKAVVYSDPQTIYCYECRACYATRLSCPVGIERQGDLVIAARCGDYCRFLELGGMKCLRCGNCTSYCVQNLDLPLIYAAGQHAFVKALRKGHIPKRALRAALVKGLVNKEFIDEIAEFLHLRQAESLG